MGIVSNELLLERGLRATFMKAYETAESPADIMGMVMTTPSTAADEKYGIYVLTALPERFSACHTSRRSI